MPIEIRLKTLLRQRGLDHSGVVQQMARDLNVHRHSIGKLYRNQVKNPSLSLLDQICDWLIDKGVSPSDLPRALFGSRATQLWDAITASMHVTFYLGEYLQETGAPAHRQRWISRWDAEAVNGIITRLTVMQQASEASHPQLRTVYATFRAGISKANPRPDELKEDIAASRKLFDRMRSQAAYETPVIIGSQRVNYLLEHFVADLFRCEPFRPAEAGRVPFYLRYRLGDRTVPSCFGGREGPPSADPPGVYYLAANQKWIACPWRPREEDAGVVIVVRYPGTDAMRISLFGFSGWATVIMGHYFDQNAQEFWPPKACAGGKQVGVYVCRIKFRPVEDEHADLVVPEAEKVEVIPLEQNVIEERLG
ncbi:MAG: helix-turn-helix transcriptional regulator [Pirellulales bacterium]|nr:helix-turn-helix transcriptional regulator [Pirellulales bacterium]